ncbi:GNAT family N-acetyltransferase [Seonamhaeicola algicola]|uniref:GNAT family N-acetyltransferase n=1 Tax=Seonamhaeicola algicola TaxID=1719036 RepID=A0A5C7AWI2_9FLAO|nr:GNAT family protein [Seonamhaeicola algicola]TXE13060.1 GNAT family N-acetyltransferase [Seonamhaeicola algicola]
MLFNFDAFEIHAINIKDAWSICNFAVANEDRLKRFFPITLQQNLTPELSEIFVNKKEKEHATKSEFLFTLKPTNSKKIIGLIYLKELNWQTKQGEFAYAIDYNFEGKGIISKSVNYLSQYAFNELGIKTLQIIVHKTNLSSVKVAKNCNFIWVKTLENAYTPPGENPLNMELYQLQKL